MAMSSSSSLRLFLCFLLLFLGQIYARNTVAHSKTHVTLFLNKKLAPKSHHKSVEKKTEAAHDPKSFSLSLMHRDAPSSPFRSVNATLASLNLNRLKRDETRVSAIASRLKLAVNGVKHSDLKPVTGEKDQILTESEFQTPLRSGLVDGSGEFFVTLGVGTPARTVNLVADTGSDVVWLQCLPCTQCYGQNDPLFDPSVSSSFSALSCGTSLCQELQIRGCRRNQCLYQVSYGDGSFTVGEFSTETLVFGSSSVPNVAIGCGHNNQGLFTGAAGLLGLGKGKLSFPSQVGPSYGNVFSYCLPSRESVHTVPMIFGSNSVPPSAKFTPMLSNPQLDTFYYVKLTGIRVGGNLVAIPSDALLLDSSGSGGVILDSGTAITRLVTSVYNPFRNAFRSGIRNLKLTRGYSLFDTCYDLSGKTSVLLPAVVLEFEGGASMELPAENTMVAVDNSGTYCFAFAPNSDDFSIIGNVQQQSFRLSFNSLTNQVGIAGDQCQ